MAKEKKFNKLTALIDALPEDDKAEMLAQLVSEATDPMVSVEDFAQKLDKLGELSESLDK